MQVHRLMIGAALVLAVSTGFASDEHEAGKALYTACAACHGADAQGNVSMNAPGLTHLEPVYIEAQLEKFKAGIRGGAGASTAATQMAPMAATLPDQQAMADVAGYIASLEPVSTQATVEGDIAVGGDFYNQLCGACHGPRGEGNKALNSPALAGAPDWYLLAQLTAFRSGTRGTHEQDRPGRQMRAMAATIPDEQTAADVVAFIQSLQP